MEAEQQFRNAEDALREFEDGEAQGMLLGKLRLMWLREGLNEGQQKLWDILEEEKKSLEENVRECRQHVQELQRAHAAAAPQTGNNFVTRTLET